MSTRNLRVLVTGSGSGVGQGIIKSLRLCNLPLTIISADINPFNAGFHVSDENVIIPKLETEESTEKIINIIRCKSIDVLFVGSEYDLLFFSKYKENIEQKTKAKVIVSPLKTVEIADDKLLTAKFLRDKNIVKSEFWEVNDLDEAIKIFRDYGAPLILKARKGTSNRNVFLIKDEQDIISNYNNIPYPMMQEILSEPSEFLDKEYTCSIFKCNNNKLFGPFTSRRTLKAGNSWIIEVKEFKNLKEILFEIGNKIPIIGSFNIQLMMTKNGPIPFEFNARFSGTTAVRSYFGFNEPEMAIRSFYLKEDLEKPKIREGVTLKYLEEVFIDNISYKDLNNNKVRGKVIKWF